MKTQRKSTRRTRLHLDPLEQRTLLAASSTRYLDQVNDIVLDAQGNQFIVGTFSNSVDVDPGPAQTWLTAGAAGGASNAELDWFVAKYAPSGNLVWAKQPGFGFGTVEVDASGNAYIAGSWGRIDSYAPDGTLRWSRQATLGANSGAGVYESATDATGLYVGGFLNSQTGTFPVSIDMDPDGATPGDTLTIDPALGVYQGAYVAKFDLVDGHFLWARAIDGQDVEAPQGLAADGTAVYASSDFDGSILGGALTNVAGTARDSAVLKLSPADGGIQTIGHYVDSGINELAADGSGLYVTGGMRSAGLKDLDPGPGQAAFDPISGGAFVARLTSGLDMVWARQVSVLENNALAVSGGHVHVAGSFEGTVDFDPGPGQANLTASGDSDFFVWDLQADGSFGWARAMGGANPARYAGPEGDTAFAIAADVSGVYSVGQFLSGQADLDPGAGTYHLVTGAGWDGFVSKLTHAGGFAAAFQIGGYVATIDDGDPGYVQVGSWKAVNTGYQYDSRTTTKAGTGTRKASWSFVGLPAGSYEVYATWAPNSKNATNARYKLNGVAGPTINQRLGPDDVVFYVDNTRWERVGTATIAGGQLVVELSDLANGTVVADAIRVVAAPPPPLRAALDGGSGGHGEALAADQVAPLLKVARQRWARLGIKTRALRGLSVRIADLPGDRLAEFSGRTLTIDADAAGRGWFVDATPRRNEEFRRQRRGLRAESIGRGRYDLLTVIAHEMGHALGLGHGGAGVMGETLEAGVRMLPGAGLARLLTGRRWR